jgi:PAS domain S-box-containing protein
MLELFFSQSLDGFFFMMLDKPIRWDAGSDKESVLDYVFQHQRITKINDAMLRQYGASPDQFLGRTPTDLFAHDLAHGRDLWRRMFDAGRLHVESDERRIDGTPICIEGDYICFYDAQGRITGHFGIQRDVTERTRYTKRLRLLHRMDRAILAARSVEEITSAALTDIRDLISCTSVSVSKSPISELTIASESSLISLPLRANGDLIGALNLGTDHSRPFTAEHIEIAQEVADSLAVAIRHAQLNEELEGQNLYLKEELERAWNFQEIVGASPAMQNVFKSMAMVAETDATVLLLGETGTGKERIAHAVHDRSARCSRPMVKVNCAALPEHLIESELFGHEKGAFTSAVSQKKGRFELADGGTIFLDEIGELPLEAQTKLLRVLQEKEFERLGGTRTIKVNVRVIAATNRDLDRHVREKTFRSDLFYRLNVFPISVPPLRERHEDIPLLARHFVRVFSERLGKRIRSIHRRAHDRLQSYEWPGNVRELANILERAVIICPGAVLLEEHVTFEREPSETATNAFPTMEEAERRLIQQAIDRTGGILGGPNGAARLLGMNRSTLWSRMRKLGIEQTGAV